MKTLDIILALLCLFIWIALYVIYFKDDLIPWLINRFTRDKPPKKGKIENGYFQDGVPIPFRENLYPPPPEQEQEEDPAQPDDTPHDSKKPDSPSKD